MCFFLPFYGIICDNLEIPWWNLPKFSQHIASTGIRILNTKKVGFVKAGFSIFANLCLLLLQKTGLIDFPEEQAPTKVKHLLPVRQVSRNFTEGNARKFIVSFAFCACVDEIKHRKTLTFSYERAQITWNFVLSTRTIVKLIGSHLKRNIKYLQVWRSGESARLPPMCPGYDSRTRRHMWAEFVGSLLCSGRIFLRVPTNIWFDLFDLFDLFIWFTVQLVEHSCSARLIWDLNKVIIIKHAAMGQAWFIIYPWFIIIINLSLPKLAAFMSMLKNKHRHAKRARVIVLW